MYEAKETYDSLQGEDKNLRKMLEFRLMKTQMLTAQVEDRIKSS